jgi:hypothetical protein
MTATNEELVAALIQARDIIKALKADIEERLPAIQAEIAHMKIENDMLRAGQIPTKRVQ